LGQTSDSIVNTQENPKEIEDEDEEEAAQTGDPLLRQWHCHNFKASKCN